MHNNLYVSKTTADDSFSSVSEALNSPLAQGTEALTIYIAPGNYKEKLEITRSNLTLIGQGDLPSDVILTYDDYAFAQMPDGSKRGTFRSYSVFLDASNVTVKNLTIENNSGDENTHGQAIALYAEGDSLFFENVRLLGRQDTLFTGPLPPKEVQAGGFIGPKQFAPRINGRQLYKNCYICGNVDFIFGSATAVFDHCTIESLSHNEDASSIQGYVAAPSTPQGQKYGYLFLHCDFISNECGANTCYLMRPWREYAKSVFIDCTMGPHIHSDGFHDWNKPSSHENGLFAVYHNKSATSDHTIISDFMPHADFATFLTDEEAAYYSNIKEIFS